MIFLSHYNVLQQHHNARGFSYLTHHGSLFLLMFSVFLYTLQPGNNNNRVNNKIVTVQIVTCWSAQGAIVEEAIRGVVAAAAHSGSAVSVEVGLTLFLKVGSRGLEGCGKGTRLFKRGLYSQMCTMNRRHLFQEKMWKQKKTDNWRTETAITDRSF